MDNFTIFDLGYEPLPGFSETAQQTLVPKWLIVLEAFFSSAGANTEENTNLPARPFIDNSLIEYLGRRIECPSPIVMKY
jgi:hypothetical protein